MLRGEIRLVDLEPARAGEADKRRPAIIVSNDRANTVAARLGRGVVTVVPVTSNTARVFPFQVLLTADEVGIRSDSKAQAEQVRAVSVDRIGPVIGRLPARLVAQLDEALRLHLQLGIPVPCDVDELGDVIPTVADRLFRGVLSPTRAHGCCVSFSGFRR